MGWTRRLIVLGAAFLIAGCQPGSSVATASIAPPGVTYRVSPPAGPIPSKDETSRAIDVFSARLRVLKVGTFSGGAGVDLTFTLTPPVDDPAIRAVLSAPGEVSFVPLRPVGAVDATEGGPVPGALTPLFGSDMIASATLDTDQTGQPAVAMQLNTAGARAFAAYTTTHIGDAFAIVLDGRIVTMPIVMSAITEGAVTVSGSMRQTISMAVLAAILASGPLPPAWQHPTVSRQ